MNLDWTTASIIVGFMVLYTKIVFDYSKIKAELQMNTTMLTKIEVLLTNHDSKIEALDKRLTTLETKHHEHHRKDDE